MLRLSFLFHAVSALDLHRMTAESSPSLVVDRQSLVTGYHSSNGNGAAVGQGLEVSFLDSLETTFTAQKSLGLMLEDSHLVTPARTNFTTMASLMTENPFLFVASVGNYELAPHDEFVLFRKSDLWAWVTFLILFHSLIILDNFYFFREDRILGMHEAVKYVAFYLLVAIAFAANVFIFRGHDAATTWMTGYMLEWMLSVDNVFVFRMVFDIYCTPDRLKHKPLFYGIVGAIFFRMIFFVVGETLIHTLHYMHIVFGGFLIYTGVKISAADEEDEDPTTHPIMIYLSRVIPFVPGYDTNGRFFVRVKQDAEGNLVYPSKTGEECGAPGKNLDLGVFENEWYSTPVQSARDHWINNPGKAHEMEKRSLIQESGSGATDSKNPEQPQFVWRCTYLFIVVICLEVTDLMFAVDSVSAIVAQVPDLYLAYTACILAMLGLRATYFVIDELMRMFRYLKYAVAFMLVFIGVKLVISKMVHIPSIIVGGVLVSTLGLCVIFSVIKERHERKLAELESQAAT